MRSREFSTSVFYDIYLALANEREEYIINKQNGNAMFLEKFIYSTRA